LIQVATVRRCSRSVRAVRSRSMSATSHSPGETTCRPPRRDAPGPRHPHDRFHEAHPGAQLGDGLTGRLLDLGGGLISSSSRSMVRTKPTGAGSTMSDRTMTSTGSTSADAVSLTSPAGSTVTTRNPARIAALDAALAPPRPRTRRSAASAASQGVVARLSLPNQYVIVSAGHESQRQAPACWAATLLRGGVPRVRTRRRPPARRKRGLDEGPTDTRVPMTHTTERRSRGHALWAHRRRHVDLSRVSSALCRD